MQFISEEELEILSKDSGIKILDAMKEIPFEEKSFIPDSCGVYILTRADGEKYVGSSYNILIRTKYHHIKNIETIDVYLTDESKYKYQLLEKWFIRQIKPSLNCITYNSIKKSIILDNDAHRKLLTIKRLIYKKTKFTVNLGDIISRLLNRDPEVIANEVIELAESTSTNKRQV